MLLLKRVLSKLNSCMISVKVACLHPSSLSQILDHAVCSIISLGYVSC